MLHAPRRSLAALAVALVAAAGWAHTARAQVEGVWRPDRVTARAEAGVFVAWRGDAPVHGFLVEVPPGWTLDGAAALRHGYEPVALTVRREAQGERYVLRADAPLRGPHRLALRLRAGDRTGRAEIALVPFTDDGGRREGVRTAVPLSVDAGVVENGNHALAFDGRGPVVLGGPLPPMGTEDPYTMELWLRTTALGEVVLSAWDGDEARPYPFELVVSEGGALVFYRGRPGAHESMTTRRPVADGGWHHVAVVNDPAAGYVRLFLDGQAADSLRRTTPFGVPAPRVLALGGRDAARSGAASGRPFNGQVDELRLWRGARDGASIRQTMRQPLPARADGDVLIDFETALPRALVRRGGGAAARVASDLLLLQPVRGLRAELDDDGVVLTWETADPQTEAFVVERSTDGRRFEPAGRVEGRAGRPAAGAPWRFVDAEADDAVLYYRIRQVLDGGAERLSATLKLGMGEEAEAPAVLRGNFPNPFRDATTIAYEVREAGHVRLSVWDVAGVRVAGLVDAVLEPGTYEHRFAPDELPSGTYFVRLQTSRGVQSHTIVRSR